MTTLLLARHGETGWNREGRVQGWAATGLTDRVQLVLGALVLLVNVVVYGVVFVRRRGES